MEEMIFKQSTEAWIGILEFEKIKGLGKKGNTQRAYLTDSPPFYYFLKIVFLIIYQVFLSFLDSGELSVISYDLKWYNSSRVDYTSKDLVLLPNTFSHPNFFF